ncbi:MAG: hypothetical protein EON58_14530 [Alphaproteobacteria bacterium]|nr:MAG: hypothetical protein EON58_14530 [Alphaproteobacteria bacterium]
MKLRLPLSIFILVLLSGCQKSVGQTDEAVRVLQDVTRSNYGVDVESFSYLISGPGVILVDASTLHLHKQENPIDRLVASGYLSVIPANKNGYVRIELTEKGWRLRSKFRSESKVEGFGESLRVGEP